MVLVFKLPLAPPETLGRRFQYALLSIDPRLSKIKPMDGYAIFNDVSNYIDLVDKALARIRGLQVKQKSSEIQIRGIDCSSLHKGPNLYAAGKKQKISGKTFFGDYLILTKAGFTVCPYTTGKGITTIAWTHAAVSYADLVLTKGQPLMGVAEDLPWLAKATLFGKIRTASGGQAPPKTRRYSLDVLGSILLGGALSFLWSQRFGDSTVEFYLVPDVVHEGFASLRDLMLQRGLNEGTAAKATWLASEYPVSLEVALAIAIADDLAAKYGSASQLSTLQAAEKLEKAANIMVVTPQKRPMVRSVTPLSTTIYVAYEPTSISSAMSTARLALQSLGAKKQKKQKELAGLRDLIGRCINSMYLQAIHCKWADHLSSCIRGLLAASEQARRSGLAKLADALEDSAHSLSRDYLKIVRKC